MLLAKTWPIWLKEKGEPISLADGAGPQVHPALDELGELGEVPRALAGVVCGHGPSRTPYGRPPTARSMSPSVPSGTRAITCSVWGLTTSIVPVPVLGTNSPPM